MKTIWDVLRTIGNLPLLREKKFYLAVSLTIVVLFLLFGL